MTDRADTSVPTVRSASFVLFRRYLSTLEQESLTAAQPGGSMAADLPEGTDPEHLAWMCRTALQSPADWPDDKLSRWLGFVQGVMTCRGLLAVGAERVASRPLFHAAYRAAGQASPQPCGPGT